MKIVFDPVSSKTNEYINILMKDLARIDIHSYSISQMLKEFKLLKNIKVVHLNWFENVNSYSEFVKKFIKLLILLITGKSIVWTFHNKQPHNNSFARLSKALMKLLAKTSKFIVIHSHVSSDILANYYGESIRKKVKYIPHPNYIDVYGERKNNKQPTSDLSLLFLGAVKPYKNIELLIEAVQSVHKDQVRLTVMGKPVNEEYKNSLLQRVRDSHNIHLQLEFVDDSKISSILSQYDILVLPYNIESSLNSGSAILAFSYGKTVICPMIGTIQDYEDTDNIMSYEYKDSAEHLQKLVDVIKRSIELKKANSSVFENMGNAMLETVNSTNNLTLVTRMLSDLYQIKK